LTTGWLIVLFLHVLAMAFFVGGQIMLAAVVVPAVRRGNDPERMRAVARRFGVGSLAALLVLLATGVAMASEFGLWDSGTLHLKLGLVVTVIALTFLHMRFPRSHALNGLVFLLTIAIVWLGLDLTR
jgi:uncharacterized membrane protein